MSIFELISQIIKERFLNDKKGENYRKPNTIEPIYTFIDDAIKMSDN